MHFSKGCHHSAQGSPRGSISPNSQHTNTSANNSRVPRLVNKVRRSSGLRVSRWSTGTVSLLLRQQARGFQVVAVQGAAMAI